MVEKKMKKMFANSIYIVDGGPMTYDYLFKRNKDLPNEYFEPTNIPCNRNEFAISTNQNKSQRTNLKEA